MSLVGFYIMSFQDKGISWDFLCRFFLHDFISLCENNIFVTKIKTDKNNHSLLIYVNCYKIRNLITERMQYQM